MALKHINTDSELYKSLSLEEKIEYERMSKAQYELRYFTNSNISRVDRQFKSN